MKIETAVAAELVKTEAIVAETKATEKAAAAQVLVVEVPATEETAPITEGTVVDPVVEGAAVTQEAVATDVLIEEAQAAEAVAADLATDAVEGAVEAVDENLLASNAKDIIAMEEAPDIVEYVTEQNVDKEPTTIKEPLMDEEGVEVVALQANAALELVNKALEAENLDAATTIWVFKRIGTSEENLLKLEPQIQEAGSDSEKLKVLVSKMKASIEDFISKQ